MSAYDTLVDLGTFDVSAYDWFIHKFSFFFVAQSTGNWTGLTTEQQKMAIRMYRVQLSAITETMPVQLYWICMVSSHTPLVSPRNSPLLSWGGGGAGLGGRP